MSSEKIILSLREAIPTVMCRPICSDCCGSVPWSHWEWNQVPKFLKEGLTANEILMVSPAANKYRKAIIPLTFKLKGKSNTTLLWSKTSWMEFFTNHPIKRNKCVFLTPEEFGCKVYQHRPIICRLFGAIMDSRAACPHGCHSIPGLHWSLGIAMTLGWFNAMELT